MKRYTQRESCKKCGGTVAQVGRMSHTGQCRNCGRAAEQANLVQLVQHHGPYFQHWRSRLAASVGAVPVDATPGQR